MDGGQNVIDKDEFLYRRIFPDHYTPNAVFPVHRKAFNPRQIDETGLSLVRAKFKSPREAADDETGNRYYIAVIRAGDLLDKGVKIVVSESHAELPELAYANRKSNSGQEVMARLSRCVRNVLGPFP